MTSHRPASARCPRPLELTRERNRVHDKQAEVHVTQRLGRPLPLLASLLDVKALMGDRGATGELERQLRRGRLAPNP